MPLIKRRLSQNKREDVALQEAVDFELENIRLLDELHAYIKELDSEEELFPFKYTLSILTKLVESLILNVNKYRFALEDCSNLEFVIVTSECEVTSSTP